MRKNKNGGNYLNGIKIQIEFIIEISHLIKALQQNIEKKSQKNIILIKIEQILLKPQLNLNMINITLLVNLIKQLLNINMIKRFQCTNNYILILGKVNRELIHIFILTNLKRTCYKIKNQN